MSDNPYNQIKNDELILRDYLAADRTVLANERTLMAYIRTSIALAAAGAALIHFLGSLATNIAGGLLLALAALVIVWGLQRFIYYKRRLKSFWLK